MITIFHGENTVKSREALMLTVAKAKQQGSKVISLAGASLTTNQLEMSFTSTDLFADNQLVVIEELHSLPKSKKKDQLIEMVAVATVDCILWEKKALTATQLKKFPKATVTAFKVSNSLFAWLDLLSPEPVSKPKQVQALHQAISDNGEFMCLTMLTRQVRMLIQAKDNGKLTGAPFMIAKLKKQAGAFTLPQLLALHAELARLDREMKSSTIGLSVAQKLDLLTVKL